MVPLLYVQGGVLFFFFMRHPRRSLLFPYTTLFRSRLRGPGGSGGPSGRCARRTASPTRSGLTSSAGESPPRDRKSTRLNSSHTVISYAVFFLKKKNLICEQRIL